MEKYGWIVDEELYYKLRQEKQEYALSELSISDIKRKLLISNGKRTLLYYEILKGFRTEDKEVLKIPCVWRGATVAHVQVWKGWRTEDKEVLKIANEEGWTVAHEQASRGWTTEDKEILKLADKNGWTVAHEQVKHGWITEDKEVLKLANKNGWTVAHEQATRGWITIDPEILTLEDKKGTPVYKKILDYYDHLAFYKNFYKLDKKFDLLINIIKQLQLHTEKHKERWANLFEYIEEKSKEFAGQVFKKKILERSKKSKI